MKTVIFIVLALAMLLVSCKGGQDYYVYNHTADSLYVLPGTGPDLSSKDKSTDDYYLVTPTKATHICLHPETNTGDGLWLLVLKKKTYDMLKDEDFRSDLYDKKLYYPFSRLETKRFEVRIYDKTLE